MRTGFIAIPAAVGAGVTAALPYFSSLVDTVSGVYGAKAKTEEYDKMVREQRRMQAELHEQRLRELAQARAEQTLQLALQASEQKRREQTNTLIAVGGIAAVISGVFLFSAMKRKR